MKIKSFLFVLVFLGSGIRLYSQDPLQKLWQFKVDPFSGAFNEFRFILEKKIKKKTWLYGAPSVVFRNKMRFNQKHFGMGLRGGVRIYFSKKMPAGLFVQPALGFYVSGISYYNDSLALEKRDFLIDLGLHGSVGYQWRLGRKGGIIIGPLGGIELWLPMVPGEGKASTIARSWYQMAFFSPIRLYLGCEIGFAIRQKNLHW